MVGVLSVSLVFFWFPLKNVDTQFGEEKNTTTTTTTSVAGFWGSRSNPLFFGGGLAPLPLPIAGIGMDFNADLAEVLTRHRGSNYFCVTRHEDCGKPSAGPCSIVKRPWAGDP